jgi:plastocyanin
MTDITPVAPVAPGDAVKVVNESYEPHDALVTAVHGDFGGQFVPCINVVYVSSDPAKRDPYGHQLERMSSLQHASQAQGMPRPGRFWENV